MKKLIVPILLMSSLSSYAMSLSDERNCSGPNEEAMEKVKTAVMKTGSPRVVGVNFQLHVYPELLKNAKNCSEFDKAVVSHLTNPKNLERLADSKNFRKAGEGTFENTYKLTSMRCSGDEQMDPGTLDAVKAEIAGSTSRSISIKNNIVTDRFETSCGIEVKEYKTTGQSVFEYKETVSDTVKNGCQTQMQPDETDLVVVSQTEDTLEIIDYTKLNFVCASDTVWILKK